MPHGISCCYACAIALGTWFHSFFTGQVDIKFSCICNLAFCCSQWVNKCLSIYTCAPPPASSIVFNHMLVCCQRTTPSPCSLENITISSISELFRNKFAYAYSFQSIHFRVLWFKSFLEAVYSNESMLLLLINWWRKKTGMSSNIDEVILEYYNSESQGFIYW